MFAIKKINSTQLNDKQQTLCNKEKTNVNNFFLLRIELIFCKQFQTLFTNDP